jgi:hypothetical protein
VRSVRATCARGGAAARRVVHSGWRDDELPQGAVAAVVDHLTTWRRELGHKLEQRAVPSLSSVVTALEPFEAPWTREVLFDCGEWTAYLDNGLYGGDPTACAPYLSASMDVECCIATHSPSYGPGHAQTSLEVLGPNGTPPLMYVRSITAHAEDGRWSWRTSGEPQAFEDVERYNARRIRDRFPRSLLIEYLQKMGISADDEGFYGHGVAISQRVAYERRQMAAQQMREWLGW